jgi:hypothetical protein
MLTVDQVRTLYKRCGPSGFVHVFNRALGLPGPNPGVREWDESTRRQAMESRGNKDEIRFSPEDVSLRTLARAIVSPYEEEVAVAMHQSATASMMHPFHAMEAATDVVPSQFANISAYNSAVIGLFEARILAAYNKPKFMLQQAIETIPSKLRSLKIMGVSNIGDVAKVREPGMSHSRANLSERYVQTPDTVNYASSVLVTREAELFDITGQVMKQADSVGESLALRKEYQIVDCVLGVTNTYKYNGTTYNTYQSAATDTAGGNFINLLTQNTIASSNAWDAFNNVLQAWTGMVDPETGQPISLEGFDVLVMPSQAMLAKQALEAGEVMRTANALTGTSFPTDFYKSINPARGMFRLLGGADQSMIYPYAYARVIAPDGLALSGNTAKKLWFAGDFKKAFNWNENLPLTIRRANINDFVMADQGLVLGVFADEMGVAGVSDPRYVIESYNTSNS